MERLNFKRTTNVDAEKSRTTIVMIGNSGATGLGLDEGEVELGDGLLKSAA